MKSRSSIINRQPPGITGFTLIEIMLVVVIILIATGISVPLFRGSFQTTQMRDAVRSTMRLARYARSLSIIRQQRCELKFEKQAIILSCGSGTNGPSVETLVRRWPEDIQISEFENSSDSEASTEAHRHVQFYTSGMNDGFELTLRDRNERQTTIICDPYSGKLTVEESTW